MQLAHDFLCYIKNMLCHIVNTSMLLLVALDCNDVLSQHDKFF